MVKILNALLAILAGVGGMFALYWLLNAAVERLPNKWEERIKPYVFVGPAVLIVGLFLVYPAVQTIHYSFADENSESYVGFDNYTALFESSGFRSTLVNNLLWILVVPAASVVIGGLVAVMADKLKPTAEKITKSVIFMPMAISFVGASTIWGFVYATRFAQGEAQIGILSAITTKLGFDPVAWLRIDEWNFNDILLMVIMVWLQAGFAMVLLSAAIKGVPEDTLEAARIDGASELQIFYRVVVPQIWPTVVVVFTTVLILVMKVFDIVYVMTGGAFDTQVIANTFIEELIEFGDSGRAAAVVVILMAAVIPAMIYQVHRFRVQEAEEMSHKLADPADPAIGEEASRTGRARMTPGGIVLRAVVLFVCLIWLIPTIGLLVSSFREEDEVKRSGWWTVFQSPLDFSQWTLDSYDSVLFDRGMLDSFVNSLVVTIPATVIPVMIAAFAAYAFTFMRFPGRDFLFIVIVGLLVVPLQVAFVPLLRVFDTLGMNGTFLAVWLAHAGFGMPLAIYILRNYMASLPREVIESAEVDGASHFRAFWSLIVPMSVPALAAYAIFQFLWVWNDLLVALIFLGAGENEVVTITLRDLIGDLGQEWHLLTAGAFITMVVPLLVFFGLQRYFVRGLTAGSVKG